MINLVCECADFPKASRQPRVAEGITEEEVSVVGFDCTAEPPVTPVSPPPTAHLSPVRRLHSDAARTDL